MATIDIEAGKPSYQFVVVRDRIATFVLKNEAHMGAFAAKSDAAAVIDVLSRCAPVRLYELAASMEQKVSGADSKQATTGALLWLEVKKCLMSSEWYRMECDDLLHRFTRGSQSLSTALGELYRVINMAKPEGVSMDAFRICIVSKFPELETVAMFAQCRSHLVADFYSLLQELVYAKDQQLATPVVNDTEVVEDDMTDLTQQDTVDSNYVGRGKFYNRYRGTFRRGSAIVCHNCGKRGHVWRQCRSELKAELKELVDQKELVSKPKDSSNRRGRKRDGPNFR